MMLEAVYGHTMHEMSIAEGISDVALDTLRQHDASVIHSVQPDLGLMSGVEPDSLLSVGKPLQRGPRSCSRIEIQHRFLLKESAWIVIKHFL